MEFYNYEGKPIAYCEDKENIYLFSGQPVAYFYNDLVYGYNGIQFGWYENGWIRDLQGKCVFCTKDASGGMLKPVCRVVPVKGVKRVAPVKAVRRVARVKAVSKLVWSNLSNENYSKQ